MTTVEDRHGKLRHRLRRKIKGRTIDCYLPGAFGSTEFHQAYEQAVEEARITTRRPARGAFAYLIHS